MGGYCNIARVEYCNTRIHTCTAVHVHTCVLCATGINTRVAQVAAIAIAHATCKRSMLLHGGIDIIFSHASMLPVLGVPGRRVHVTRVLESILVYTRVLYSTFTCTGTRYTCTYSSTGIFVFSIFRYRYRNRYAKND